MKTEFYAMEYEAWDQGTNLLTAEEEGCYLRLCHQMYRVRGPIENWSFVTLAGMWRCHPNKARSLLGHLEVKGKIRRTPEGHLTNTRVTQELHHREAIRAQKVEAGRAGGTQSGVIRSKPLETLEVNEAPASSDVKQENNPLPLNEPHYTTLHYTTGQDNSLEAPQAATPPKRASRLQEDWEPSEADLAYAAKPPEGFSTPLTAAEISIEATKFRNYWIGKGKDATKRSWPKTWQNWIISAYERKAGQPPPRLAPGAVVPFKARPAPRIALEIAPASDQEWSRRLDCWRKRRQWDRELWGPTPEQRVCACPRHLFAAALVDLPQVMLNLGNGKAEPFDTTPAPKPPAGAPDLDLGVTP